MPTAYNLIPPRFEDGRHKAVSAGLQACGYLADHAFSARASRLFSNDVVVTWNAHTAMAAEGLRLAEAAGAAAIVAEEAYTRRLWPEKHFALALDGHNGSGRWFPGGAGRWTKMGIALKPWRKDGKHILVCAARGMGAPAMREPRGWADDVVRRLAQATARPVRLRRHPGKRYADRPLEDDLAGAWAVVVWASNCATHALVAGIPVFFEAPHIITAGAAERGIKRIERPAYPERLPVFERLAWAQWTMDEIRAGGPFQHLLDR